MLTNEENHVPHPEKSKSLRSVQLLDLRPCWYGRVKESEKLILSVTTV
jgi:hypothetical protein